MHVNGKPQRTIWVHPANKNVICIIDQRFLPHSFIIAELKNIEDTYRAIADMQVRGAPLIGVIHEVTGGWTAALGFLVAVSVAYGVILLAATVRTRGAR